MKSIVFAICAFISGCCIPVDQVMPTVSRTELPGTKYLIVLYGPLDKGRYYYEIHTPDGSVALRDLGMLSLDERVTPKLEDLGDGVFRITWGIQPIEAFATIDTKKKLIVDDSNDSNPKGAPFETPEYLRPEHARNREAFSERFSEEKSGKMNSKDHE